MIGFDLTLLGGCLGILGSLVLAKSYLAPSFSRQAAQAFLDQNPYLVRNQIVQRVEALTGTFWLVLGFFFASLGTVLTSTTQDKDPAGDYWLHFLVIMGSTVILFLASLRWAAYKSKQEYRPMMTYLQRDLFSQCTGYLSTSGLEQYEVKNGANVSQDIREQRLANTRRQLDQIGELIGVPRNPLELDRDYLNRLKPFFLNQ